MPGLKGGAGRYHDLLDRTAGLRSSAGKALYDFVNHKAPGPVPTLKKRWVEAMYWFGEARREPAEFVSLVKAGIALDIFDSGEKGWGNSDPLLRTIRARKIGCHFEQRHDIRGRCNGNLR